MAFNDVKREVARLTLPVNGLLILWVAILRCAFAPGYGMALVTVPMVTPVLLATLGPTTLLAYAQHLEAQGRLTHLQFVYLMVNWLSLFGIGLFLVDGDLMKPTPGASPFMIVAGPEALELSDKLFGISLLGFVVSYLCLLVAPIAGLHGRRNRVSEHQHLYALPGGTGPVRP